MRPAGVRGGGGGGQDTGFPAGNQGQVALWSDGGGGVRGAQLGGLSEKRGLQAEMEKDLSLLFPALSGSLHG